MKEIGVVSWKLPPREMSCLYFRENNNVYSILICEDTNSKQTKYLEVQGTYSLSFWLFYECCSAKLNLWSWYQNWPLTNHDGFP